MAVNWLTLLKTVPWSDVIANAPALAEGAKKLWRGTANDPKASAAPVQPASAASVAISPLDELAGRVGAQEEAIEGLHAQMVESSKLLSQLATQNNNLIARVEADRRRLIQLAWVTAASVFLGFVSLYFGLRTS